MVEMERILQSIRERYAPLCILVYGSWRNGTNTGNSDFDCLIVVREKALSHDMSVVDGVPLDLFLYTQDEIRTAQDISDFVQLYDALIVQDTDEMGAALVQRVRSYVDGARVTTAEEKAEQRAWLRKMLERTLRGDAEGWYRYHWALVDSLEIYCNQRDQFYFGPKKTIQRLEREDPEGFALLDHALRQVAPEALRRWIFHVIGQNACK